MIYLMMIDVPEDRTKFEKLYLKYRNLMFYVANEILKNQHDAEDAVHQAFLAMLKHLDKISEIDSPKTRSYVVIVVERKAIDILRLKKKENEIELNEKTVGNEIPLPGDGGLADAMAKLPSHYRDVLLLKYDNGFSTREIAQVLGITDSGVRKLLARAKTALKHMLDKEGES